MALISRILVPVVFSDRCQDAARYAAALACRFHSELILLHVFVQPWAAYSSPEGYATPPPYDLESTLAQVQEELDEFLADELRSLKVQRILMEGDPARVIAQFACSEGCDLIVMPTHGYGPFRRFLLGSVTAKVLHDVACPVITGPHMESAPGPPCFRKVLCALDLSPESRGVLEWAGLLASEFGSDVSIVHVIPTSTVRLEGVSFDSQWRTELVAHARRDIAKLQEAVKVPGEIMVEVGDVPGAVREAAQSWGADLVVAGRGRAHGMLGRLRANTYGIVRESRCPVAAV
ncbi:MAG TPA: universal stress protein [Bryobacteraceae bacterium]|nr:universal stress protein [Bryobacteraceae bacterium]